jgi:hypothetical protein
MCDVIVTNTDLDRLLALLTAYSGGENTFNQYRDVDPELDRPHGAAVRCQNLRCYLETFAGARFVLVGEAAGYAGCRFSGIPFTCEAQIVAADPSSHSRQLAWTLGKSLARSSRAKDPWVERSATMVWEALDGRRDCVLWNAYPWHPFDRSGPLSNRAPGRDLKDGLSVLACLLSLFPAARPYAVGRVAQRALAAIGLQASYIRHPSRGGKQQFLAGVAALK